MVYIPSTWQDWWRKRKKLEDPHYLTRHFKTTGLQQNAVPQHSAGQEHTNLVADPMGQWGASLEAFHSWQVSSGFDILKSGNGIETASDAHNVSLAQEEPTPSLASSSPVVGPPPAPAAATQPLHRRDPFNCPFSTIPGAPGPMGPPKMPGG